MNSQTPERWDYRYVPLCPGIVSSIIVSVTRCLKAGHFTYKGLFGSWFGAPARTSMWRQVECAPPGNIEQQLKAVHRKAASSYDKPKAEPHRRQPQQKGSSEIHHHRQRLQGSPAFLGSRFQNQHMTTGLTRTHFLPLPHTCTSW